MRNIALLLASGTGSRCGLDYPKQFAEVCGKTILEHSVDVFENHSMIDEIILVTNAEYVEKVKNLTVGYKKVSKVIKGGQTRKDSSYNGISSIKYSEAKVLIHDAVRPLIDSQVITNCIESLETYNAVCVTIPSVDTVFIVDEDEDIIEIPKRVMLRRAQTPQCFKLSVIRQAHELALRDTQCKVTDDCGLIINYTSEKIHTIAGSNDNIKITYIEDIDFVKKRLIRG